MSKKKWQKVIFEKFAFSDLQWGATLLNDVAVSVSCKNCKPSFAQKNLGSIENNDNAIIRWKTFHWLAQQVV
jgi:hypothetical protein